MIEVATMSTIYENVREVTLTSECKPDCSACKNPPLCSPNCRHKSQGSTNRFMVIFFNILGILVAVLATYMIVSTDSKLYLVFWISYSVLRRMMIKPKKPHGKFE